MTDFNKNDRQQFFNQIRGVLREINNIDNYCSITIDVGHENVRKVNLVAKKEHFDRIIEKSNAKVEDKVSVRFYLSSRNKNDRWYTSANILDIRKD